MLYYQRKEKCLENTTIVLALVLQIGNLGSQSKEKKKKKKDVLQALNNVIFPVKNGT